jgi:hypothetical protein
VSTVWDRTEKIRGGRRKLTIPFFQFHIQRTVCDFILRKYWCLCLLAFVSLDEFHSTDRGHNNE